MTNAREIKQVFQPLLDRHTDLLKMDGSSLCITPVRHITFRIIIERSAHADFCVPQWTMLENFQFGTNIKISIGNRRGYLIRSRSSLEKNWIWSDPIMIRDMISVFESEVLLLLRSINTLEKYSSFCSEKLCGYIYELPADRLIVDIALGKLEAAQRSWHNLALEYGEDKYPDWWLYQTCRTKVMTVAEPLLAGDRLALAKILHGWEADNIRGTKIEPYWEPTPFPLETGGT